MKVLAVASVVLPLVVIASAAAAATFPDDLIRRQLDSTYVYSFPPYLTPGCVLLSSASHTPSLLSTSPFPIRASTIRTNHAAHTLPPPKLLNINQRFNTQTSTFTSSLTPSRSPPTCDTPLLPSTSPPSPWWYATLLTTPSGATAPFLPYPLNATYPPHRNALAYHADPTGRTPSTAAIQSAIDHGGVLAPHLRNTTNRGPSFSSTLTPAIVYLPPGTYLLDAPLQLWVGTVLVGDAVDPPTLKVAPGWARGQRYVVRGKEPGLPGTNGFFVGMRNVVVDSTGVDGTRDLVLVDWTVSQGTQLANVRFEMPVGGRHVGLRYVSFSLSRLTGKLPLSSFLHWRMLTFFVVVWGLKHAV